MKLTKERVQLQLALYELGYQKEKEIQLCRDILEFYAELEKYQKTLIAKQGADQIPSAVSRSEETYPAILAKADPDNKFVPDRERPMVAPIQSEYEKVLQNKADKISEWLDTFEDALHKDCYFTFPTAVRELLRLINVGERGFEDEQTRQTSERPGMNG